MTAVLVYSYLVFGIKLTSKSRFTILSYKYYSLNCYMDVKLHHFADHD